VDAASLAYLDGRSTVESGSLPRAGLATGMAVTAWVARERGWRPGSAVPLTFADGRDATFTVAAVLADRSAPADLLLDRDTVRGHDPSALTSRVYVAGAAADELAPALVGLGARTLDPVTYAREADTEEGRLVHIFVLALLGLACGYTAIAVGNTLLMATAGRLRDLAVLRLAGATRRQVLATIAGEATLVVSIGALLGLAVAGVALFGVRAGLTDIVDGPVDVVFDWPVVGAVCAVCLALALAASTVPAALAVRASPAAYAAAE
jgi:putative ABC transport system permease protein